MDVKETLDQAHEAGEKASKGWENAAKFVAAHPKTAMIMAIVVVVALIWLF